MTYFRHLWIAFESGWRAGKKQARKRWTELNKSEGVKPAAPQSPATE